jgi:hypothetical protein
MKFAAFISIIISVAVMFAACQGAVGKVGDKGEKGDPGTDGTPGTPGTPGEPGKSPLYAKAGTAPIPVYINDGEEANAPGDAETVTLSEHFSGGIGEVTVGDAVVDTGIAEDDRIFTVDTEDGVVTFAIRMNTADPPAPAATGQREAQDYTVDISDTGGPSLTLTLTVRRNQPPSAFDVTAFSIGTSTAKLETAREPNVGSGNTASCATHHECTLTITGADSDTSDVASLEFSATTESMALEIVKESRNELVFRGLTTTDNGNDATDDDTAEVTITATDPGGLTMESTVTVTVDGAPTGEIPAQRVEYSATSAVVITNLDAFFTDPDGDDEDLTYSVKTGYDTKVATVTVDDANPPTMSVAPAAANGGSTQVTIVASEAAGLSQSGEATFTLTVTP